MLYLLAQKIPATAKRWCEKTPSNVLNIDFILKAYEGKVKIIHIYRDGRDVVMSVHGRVSKTIVSPEIWTGCVRAGLKFKDNPNVYHLRYEDLVLNFRNEVANLMEFLDVSYSEAMEQFHKVSNINENASLVDGHGYQGSFSLRPLSVESIGKWKRSKADEVERFMANEDAVGLLKQLGYLQ